ncbi:unnamed protein product, partial [Musa acuminata subsp. burmannicoides]
MIRGSYVVRGNPRRFHFHRFLLRSHPQFWMLLPNLWLGISLLSSVPAAPCHCLAFSSYSSDCPDRGCAAGELMKKRFLDVHPVEERVVVLAEDALRVCKTTARRCDGLPEGEGKEHGRGAATTSGLVSSEEVEAWWRFMDAALLDESVLQNFQVGLLLVEEKETVAVCEEVRQVLAEVNASSENDAAHSVFGQTKGLRIGGYQQPAGVGRFNEHSGEDGFVVDEAAAAEIEAAAPDVGWSEDDDDDEEDYSDHNV